MSGRLPRSSQPKPRPSDGFGYSDSAKANSRALRAMTEAEKLTGRTAEQLAAEQAEMKRAALKRLGKAPGNDPA